MPITNIDELLASMTSNSIQIPVVRANGGSLIGFVSLVYEEGRYYKTREVSYANGGTSSLSQDLVEAIDWREFVFGGSVPYHAVWDYGSHNYRAEPFAEWFQRGSPKPEPLAREIVRMSFVVEPVWDPLQTYRVCLYGPSRPDPSFTFGEYRSKEDAEGACAQLAGLHAEGALSVDWSTTGEETRFYLTAWGIPLLYGEQPFARAAPEPERALQRARYATYVTSPGSPVHPPPVAPEPSGCAFRVSKTDTGCMLSAGAFMLGKLADGCDSADVLRSAEQARREGKLRAVVRQGKQKTRLHISAEQGPAMSANNYWSVVEGLPSTVQAFALGGSILRGAVALALGFQNALRPFVPRNRFDREFLV